MTRPLQAYSLLKLRALYGIQSGNALVLYTQLIKQSEIIQKYPSKQIRLLGYKEIGLILNYLLFYKYIRSLFIPQIQSYLTNSSRRYPVFFLQKSEYTFILFNLDTILSLYTRFKYLYSQQLSGGSILPQSQRFLESTRTFQKILPYLISYLIIYLIPYFINIKPNPILQY